MTPSQRQSVRSSTERSILCSRPCRRYGRPHVVGAVDIDPVSEDMRLAVGMYASSGRNGLKACFFMFVSSFILFLRQSVTEEEVPSAMFQRLSAAAFRLYVPCFSVRPLSVRHICGRCPAFGLCHYSYERLCSALAYQDTACGAQLIGAFSTAALTSGSSWARSCP